jgi:glycosyltransferase involved in cell wall biosynthesis
MHDVNVTKEGRKEKLSISNGVRLLITTQAVDTEDPVMGFFVEWLAALSGRFEHIHVICLKKGPYTLPPNVSVHSLGKEEGNSRFTYVMRFFRYCWHLRREYDAAFVHMNQEYVLLGSLFWRALGKRVYLWRNHVEGTFFTNMAVALSTKVFCTSRYSYTAKFKKTSLMPVGVDLSLFKILPGEKRGRKSILFFSRFAPTKRPHILVDALDIVSKHGADFTANVYGDPLPKDSRYYDEVQKKVAGYKLEDRVTFKAGVPHAQAVQVFNEHEIYVDLGASGSYNKTLFEAAACGCFVISASKDFKQEAGEQFYVEADNVHATAERISEFLVLSAEEKSERQKKLLEAAQRNSLEHLTERLSQEIR